MKNIKLIFFILFLVNPTFAQQVEVPSFHLTGVDVTFKVTGVSDSIQTTIIFEKDEYRKELTIYSSGGIADTSVILDEAGTYDIYLNDKNESINSIRILPGWFSLVPPLLAILLALVIRQVLVSLAAGIFVGAVLIYDYNPLTGFLRFADTIIINSLTSVDHMFILVFTLMIGGVVGIISRNGGTAGLANLITQFAKKARSGMIASWLMGLVVFFDDYANSLIIGNMMRPITDKLKVSREKLAYIVDSTAAPIASIVIISTWIGYELGLIASGLNSIGSDANAYDIFLSTIPYRFYPIAAIFFVFLTSYMERDFGPMYLAEKRARLTGELAENETVIKDIKKNEDELYQGRKAKWYNGIVPILIILFGTIAGLFYTGINAIDAAGSANYSLQNIISSSDSYSSLLWSSLVASLVAILMTVMQKILTLNDAVDAWHKGVQSMLFACIILVFAWGISDVTNELKTADYLISILSDAINPRFLPVLVFIVCGLISFSTGTSWGTMAIVMPLVIPLASKMTELNGYSTEHSMLVINGVISSVLAGSVFGDHCSPIADTTILSSMASGCNHIDHVKTQLPYAILVGVVCMLLGDIPTAFGVNPFISIALIFGVLFILLFFFGKKIPRG